MPPGGGHCSLCKKLKRTGLSAAEIEQISVSHYEIDMKYTLTYLQESHKQCSECGLAGTNVKDPCGTCKHLGKSCYLQIQQTLDICALQEMRKRTYPILRVTPIVRDAEE